MPESEVINNTKDKQFEIRSGNLISKVPYNIKGELIGLFHTEVPKELQGRGLATRLTEYALNYAKENKLMILPYCPFIAKYIKEHPEWLPYVKRFR